MAGHTDTQTYAHIVVDGLVGRPLTLRHVDLASRSMRCAPDDDNSSSNPHLVPLLDVLAHAQLAADAELLRFTAASAEQMVVPIRAVIGDERSALVIHQVADRTIAVLHVPGWTTGMPPMRVAGIRAISFQEFLWHP